MAEPLVFGSPEPEVQYTERRAAYVVIINRAGQVATVKPREKHFLPGGGALPGEAPEATVMREVREELARNVRLLRKLGETVQYFIQPRTIATTSCKQHCSWANLRLSRMRARANTNCIGCR